MSRFAGLRKHLPLRSALSLYLKIKTGQFQNLSVPFLPFPFSIRNNPFDYAVFEEVLLKKAYDIPLDFLPLNIIDGGGNVGLTAVFFAAKYPRASIVTLEPDEDNFRLLQHNTSFYRNVQAWKSGVWNRSAELVVKDLGYGNDSLVVEEVPGPVAGSVPAFGIDDIMVKMGWEHIDILKLDVEGSEKEIFRSNFESWLPKTRVLIIELHDRIREGCSKAVLAALSGYDFSLRIAGENLVFVNQAFRQGRE